MNLAEMILNGPLISKVPVATKTDRRNRAQTNKVREEIMKVLAHGPTSTKNVARDLGITRPAALNLLTKMRKDGLVTSEVIEVGIAKKALWSNKCP